MGFAVPYGPYCDCQIIAGFACVLSLFKRGVQAWFLKYSRPSMACVLSLADNSWFVWEGFFVSTVKRLLHVLPGNLTKRM